MNLITKRLLAVMTCAAITLSGAVSLRAAGTVDVIVSLTPPDDASPSEFAAEYAEYVTGRFGLVSDYTYDTLLCGFHLEAPEELLPAILALDGVEDITYCGTYSAMEAQTAAASADAAASARALAGLDGDIAYTGDGVLVAVLDDSFDVTHPAFSGDGITQTLDLAALDAAPINQRLSVMRYVESAEDFYVNAKIPFRFDYAGRDTDVSAAGNHGTHVAGIVGASFTSSGIMEGAAPGCQLLLMKIFDDSGQASDQTLIAALEDALRLGADVVNLSLGEYAGSATADQASNVDRILEKMRAAGCFVVCAAGNYSVSTERSELADTTMLPAAAYTDYGTLSAPAASDSVLAVASADNRYTFSEYILHPASGTMISFTDTAGDFSIVEDSFTAYFDGQTLPYAVIPGIGEEADYEGIDVSGKLALIRRGITTFTDKVNIAADHGALGAIIYNNEDGEFSMDLTGAAIPAIAISKSDGERLASAKERTLSFDTGFLRFEESGSAGQISDFSSWGTTPSLTLKPDITGIGGSVFSAVAGGGYAGLSGTSMSAPQLSGIAALLVEKLDKEQKVMPTAYASVIRDTLMNTAVPILQKNGIESSPRAQGAGLVNASAALNAKLRVTYAPNNKPKAELYDLIGNFTYLDVKLQNLTNEPLTVSVGATLSGDGWTETEIDGKTEYFSTTRAEADTVSRILCTGEEGNLNRNAADYSPLCITLAPGEARTLPLTLELDEGYHDALDEIFTNGHFVEGYVYCEADGMSYSLPYMGYRGDWTDAPVLDASYYGDALTLFGGTLFATYAGSSAVVFEAPDNADIAFSPNGDGFGDVLAFGAVYLRNVRDGKITVCDPDGEVIYTQTSGAAAKSFGFGTAVGFELGWQGDDGLMKRYRFPDGLYTVNFTYTLDFRGNLTQSYDYTVRIDTEAPTLTGLSLEDGILTVSAEDVSGVKTITVLEHDGADAFKLSVTDADSAAFDLSDFDGDMLYYEIIDYALNTRVGRLSAAELAKSAN